MFIYRQLATFIMGVFVFVALVAAMSRLLSMKETPDYISNATKGIANLYRGAFNR